MLYGPIFLTNVLRVLHERNMTKAELSRASRISMSYLSELTNGKANPSLQVMEEIALALDVPLPTLLESTDLDARAMANLSGGHAFQGLPKGFERVTAILPEHQAFIVRGWDEATRKKLRLR